MHWQCLITISDWLIFFCGTLILYQKRNENVETYDEKQN